MEMQVGFLAANPSCEVLVPSGRLQLTLGKVIDVQAAFHATVRGVVDTLKTHRYGVDDATGIHGGYSAHLVEPIGLRTLDANFLTSGNGHGAKLNSAVNLTAVLPVVVENDEICQVFI